LVEVGLVIDSGDENIYTRGRKSLISLA
jgi:hypothetical protein